MSTAPDATVVDLWFDPVCPYSWTASRWLREVGKRRPLVVRHHVMSLYLLNEHRTDVAAGYRRSVEASRGPARVATAAVSPATTSRTSSAGSRTPRTREAAETEGSTRASVRRPAHVRAGEVGIVTCGGRRSRRRHDVRRSERARSDRVTLELAGQGRRGAAGRRPRRGRRRRRGGAWEQG